MGYKIKITVKCDKPGCQNDEIINARPKTIGESHSTIRSAPQQKWFSVEKRNGNKRWLCEEHHDEWVARHEDKRAEADDEVLPEV